jgi:hypothetical protein
MNRDARVVYSTTDGDLRKARDPRLKERQADGNRVKVRREVVVEVLKAEGYLPVLAGG